MSVSEFPAQKREPMPRLLVELALTPAAVRESQALRYAVFGEEMGANLPTASEQLDRDHYDPFCHHLLVRREDTRAVVGSTRILTEANARVAGSFYSESEFDLSGLLPLNGNAIEIGRTCIHPDFRNGITINTLWVGLAAFMEQHKVDYLFGCASVGLHDGGEIARRILQQIGEKYRAPEQFQVEAHLPLELPETAFGHGSDKVKLPPLLNAYLKLGAWIVGTPSIDPEFNVADVFILLDIHNLASRYRRRFVENERHNLPPLYVGQATA